MHLVGRNGKLKELVVVGVCESYVARSRWTSWLSDRMICLRGNIEPMIPSITIFDYIAELQSNYLLNLKRSRWLKIWLKWIQGRNFR